MWAIVKEIAQIFDNTLSESVYSYRLKKNPKKSELFRESDALALPFLKSKNIKTKIDPFEPWYAAWPSFEERTKEEIGSGYQNLVVSDIAGYFENINIDILKDQIMSSLDSEPILCNFIAEAFSEWVLPSPIGHRPKRSIPQGTGISSFFGNIYLKPIDDHFANLNNGDDFVYIRYMDDIRIFTKDAAIARKCIFELEKSVRDLHLNLQSAKTKILQETVGKKSITNSLFDDRLDEITQLRGDVDKVDVTEEDADIKLQKIARREPLNETSFKLHRVKHPSSDLTDRSMRAWMNLCIKIGSSDYIPTLLGQITTNHDQRISRIFVNTCRVFPRHASLGRFVESFVDSDNNIHQYHEAELIRGCRYLSILPDGVWKRALSNCLNRDNCNFYLKIQSLLLLGMRSHSKDVLNKLRERMRGDTDIISHPYYFSVLGQLPNTEREQVVRDYTWHANQHNQEFGLLLGKLARDYPTAKKFIEYVFGGDTEITDWQGVLFHLSGSENRQIRSLLKENIKFKLKVAGRGLLKARLNLLKSRIETE